MVVSLYLLLHQCRIQQLLWSLYPRCCHHHYHHHHHLCWLPPTLHTNTNVKVSISSTPLTHGCCWFFCRAMFLFFFSPPAPPPLPNPHPLLPISLMTFDVLLLGLELHTPRKILLCSHTSVPPTPTPPQRLNLSWEILVSLPLGRPGKGGRA